VDILWRLANPGEWGEMLDELAQIAQFAKENPVEFAKQLANWDQWQTEPGRALGNTAFGLVPGAGALAKLRSLHRFLKDSHAARPDGDATAPQPDPVPQPAPQPDPAHQPDPNQPGPTQQAQPAPQPGPAPPAPLPSTPDSAPEAPATAPDRIPDTAAPDAPAPRHTATNDRSTTPRATARPSTPDSTGRRASFGHADSTDYRKTFGDAHPEARDKVVVHHAVERQAPRRYPDAGISQSELHSLENLRGIPKEANARLHLSQIRKAWNRFYRENPTASKEQLLDFATWVDDTFGHLFIPPVR
jgi:outer membrane biosynthesis protein TonB